MAPLTFPNEKQMVSGEGSGPTAGPGLVGKVLGVWIYLWGARGLLHRARDRRGGEGRKEKLGFSAVVCIYFFLIVLFFFDAGG